MVARAAPAGPAVRQRWRWSSRSGALKSHVCYIDNTASRRKAERATETIRAPQSRSGPPRSIRDRPLRPEFNRRGWFPFRAGGYADAMAETIPPPESATRNTHCTAEQYEALYRRSLDDPDGFWAEQAQRIDWVTGADEDRQLVLRSVGNQMVRGRCSQPVSQLRRPASARSRRRRRDHLGGRRARRHAAADLWRAARRGRADGERAEGARRAQGRPDHPLSADDPGGGGGDARLRADRRGAQRRLRRLLARGAARPDRGLRQQARRHRRRRQARRQAGAAQGQCRCGAGARHAGRGGAGRPPRRQ